MLSLADARTLAPQRAARFARTAAFEPDAVGVGARYAIPTCPREGHDQFTTNRTASVAKNAVEIPVPRPPGGASVTQAAGRVRAAVPPLRTRSGCCVVEAGPGSDR
jgi:hypothetical protein